MENTPFITIGIPTYNSEKYIRACIDSILNQTYHNIKIIVSDNGSTDNTEKIVLSYNDPKIKFHKNKKNLFCYGNYNVIIDIADGEFLAIYHSDDVYEKTIVEKQVEFLQKNPGTMAVFTESYLINSKGKIIGQINFPEEFLNINILDFKKAYNGFLKYGDFLICPSAMFVKKVFSIVGNFKEENFFLTTTDEKWKKLLQKYSLIGDMIFTANDLEMWLRILQNYSIGILHEKLIYHRLHPAQGSFEHSTGYENFFIVMDYYSQYAKQCGIISKTAWKKYEIKKLQYEFFKGQDNLLKGNFLQVKQYFSKFLKSSYFFYLFSNPKNFFRICWAILVIVLKPSKLFQKMVYYYRKYKEKIIKQKYKY